MPASDPSERIGSLFIDFGGPGGPDITDLVNRADTVFSPAIRARFDLVTWDPRGVEYSDPVNCFATDTADTNYFNSIPVFPYPQSGRARLFPAERPARAGLPAAFRRPDAARVERRHRP